MKNDFYKAFEERYRGSRESIAVRLRAYLPFVEPLAQLQKGAQTIDLGCGRGEWLELMGNIGFSAYGVDLNEGMLEDCHERALSVEQGDAIAYLTTLSDDSHAIVSAFHFVEHISFDQLSFVVSEALRVLIPGGLLIMETPNPENIIVATRNFYLDPTHKRMIPPQLLSFLPEYYGFPRTKILRLQESRDLSKSESVTLNDVLEGASPDYAVIAQKAASTETFALLDKIFDQDYGLTLDTIALRYDAAITAKTEQAEIRAVQAQVKAQQAKRQAEQAHAKAQEAHTKAQKVETRAVQGQVKVQEAHAKSRKAEMRLAQVEVKVQEAEARAAQAETKAQETLVRAAQAEVKAQEAEIRAAQAEIAFNTIYKSRSWKITAPLRWTGDVARWLMHGSIAWLTFAPESRPRRILRSAFVYMKSAISTRPLLKAAAARLLAAVPKLDARLRLIGNLPPTECPHILNPMQEGINEIDSLSPRARKIYFDLKAAIKQRKKGQH
jgi:O-antigen chain-terminating methyltransferase